MIVLALHKLPATVSRVLIALTTSADGAPHPRLTELIDGLEQPAATPASPKATASSDRRSLRLGRLVVVGWSAPITGCHDWAPGPGPEEPELGQLVHGYVGLVSLAGKVAKLLVVIVLAV